MAPKTDPPADFSDVTGGSSSTAPTPPAPDLRTYTVVKGDSLSRIAKEFYGSANKWRVIYDANKSVIGNNPDLIKPGQVFTIPKV